MTAPPVSVSQEAPVPLDEPPMPEPPMDLWEPPMDIPPQTPVKQPVRRDDPAPRPVIPPAAPAAPVEPKPAPAPAVTPVTEAKRILRPLKAWTEAVDRVRSTSPMAASFLVSAKAYTTEDGGVVIKLESDFIRSMVSREGAPDALRAALSVCLNRKLAASDILYEVDDAPKSEGSLLDLIIEASEDTSIEASTEASTEE